VRSRAFDAVLLDAGGVLVLPSHQPIASAFAEIGLEVDASRLDAAHYAGMRGLDEAPHGPFDWRHYLAAYLETLGVPAARRSTAGRHLREVFDGSATLWRRAIPGVHDALAALAATGVRLGVVSNAEGTVEARLAELAICQVGRGAGVAVEVVVDSHHVGVEKPDPAIFALALERIGAAAERSIFVGDVPSVDVAGARAAGIAPVLLDRHGAFPDVDAPRIAQLEELLARLPGTGEAPGEDAETEPGQNM